MTRQPTPKCPYCNNDAMLVDSKIIYHGKSYGWAWKCPSCPDTYVGCHRGGQKPLGRLANAELRGAKMLAHAAFDPIWKSGSVGRSAAYQWLAKAMGIPVAECHIGMFDVAQCQRVVELCQNQKEW